MPALKSDATVPSTSAIVSSFKPKIKASKPPLKDRLSSVAQRLDNYMTNNIFKYLRSRNYISFKPVASVNDCMIDMTKYVTSVIDNADVYEGHSFGGQLWRYEPSGRRSQCVSAYRDIDSIVKAAVKCIDIIDKRVMPK